MAVDECGLTNNLESTYYEYILIFIKVVRVHLWPYRILHKTVMDRVFIDIDKYQALIYLY